MVLEPDEIIENCEIKLIHESREKMELKQNISAEYKEILNILEDGAIHVNSIYNNINNNISEINSVLTLMELDGYIEKMPGNMFRTASDIYV